MTAPPASTYSAERSRIELHAGDELVAWVDLRPGGPSTIIAHTEVLPGHDGQGLGRAAVRAAVEHIAADGKSVIAVCPFALALLARRPHSARWAHYALLVVAAILLVNVAWHVAAAIVLRGYAPGVASAVVVNLPLTLGVLRGARRDGWLSRRGLWLVSLLALALHGPVLIAVVSLVSLSR